MTLGKERLPEDTLLEQLPFCYRGHTSYKIHWLNPNQSQLEPQFRDEARLYFRNEWSDAGGDSDVNSDYLAFPFFVPRELVKSALQSPAHEATIRVEAVRRIHKEAWHHWTDYHTGGGETSEPVTMELYLRLTEKGPVLSIHDPFKSEFFPILEKTCDAGRPGAVFRAIRWNHKINAYKLLTVRHTHTGGNTSETTIETVTFDNPLVLVRAIANLQREGVAVIQAKGELEHFVQQWVPRDIPSDYDPADWWDWYDKETTTSQSGKIGCELRVVDGSLAPFTPTVKIENSP